MSGPRPAGLRVLLLCDHQPLQAATVVDHIEAFLRHSRHEVWAHSGVGGLPPELPLECFDAVVVHYSLFVGVDAYLTPADRRRLREFPGPKAVFLQDEYRCVEANRRALEEIAADALFTVVPEPEIEKVYPAERCAGMRRVNVLTGYVTDAMRAWERPPLRNRPVDLGYRGRRYPAWHGELGREKWRIAERVLADAPAFGLTCDISWREEDRLYGVAWRRFLTRCKAQLGVESGASVFDDTGTIAERCERHERESPATPYAELRRRYFATHEGRVRLNQISSRVFEAAAAGCLLVLYEGEYSGVVRPWDHFVPLRKDHGNMGQIVEILRDVDRAQDMVDRTHHEVVCAAAWGYAHLIGRVDDELARAFAPERGRRREELPASARRRLASAGPHGGPPRWPPVPVPQRLERHRRAWRPRLRAALSAAFSAAPLRPWRSAALALASRLSRAVGRWLAPEVAAPVPGDAASADGEAVATSAPREVPCGD